MNDQPVIDAYHHNDLRKTRSAMQSIIRSKPIPAESNAFCPIWRIDSKLTQCGCDGQCIGYRPDSGGRQTNHLRGINDLIRLESNRLPLNILGYTEQRWRPVTSTTIPGPPLSISVYPGQWRSPGKTIDLVRQRMGLCEPHVGCGTIPCRNQGIEVR